MDNKKLNGTELKEKEIDEASGGVKNDDDCETFMMCRSVQFYHKDCDFSTLWAGNHVGKIHKCPMCGKMSLCGMHLI